MKNSVYLEEGIDKLLNCPNCKREICFLPDISSIPKSYGRFTVKKWQCYNCDTEFFQTEKLIK